MSGDVALGIDPGKLGAIAILDAELGCVVDVKPMPVLKGGKVRGKKTKTPDEYDLISIAYTLKFYRERAVLTTLERSQPLPVMRSGKPDPRSGKQTLIRPGGIAQFNRGVQRGFEWMLAVLDMPYQLAPPAEWMKVMHLGVPKGGTTKQRSIIAAQRLFPETDLRRTSKCTTQDDGMAEALLLAEFGRRTLNGKVVA